MNQIAYLGIRGPYADLVDQAPRGMFINKADAWALVQAVMMGANVVLLGKPGDKFGAIELWLRSVFRQVDAEDGLLFYNVVDANKEKLRLASSLYERNQRGAKRYRLNSTIVLRNGADEVSPLLLAWGDLRIHVSLPLAVEAVASKELIIGVQAHLKGPSTSDIQSYRDFLECVSFSPKAEELLGAVLELDAFRATCLPRNRYGQGVGGYIARPTSQWIMAARWLKGAAALDGRHQVDADDFDMLRYVLGPTINEASETLRDAMERESWYQHVANFIVFTPR